MQTDFFCNQWSLENTSLRHYCIGFIFLNRMLLPDTITIAVLLKTLPSWSLSCSVCVQVASERCWLSSMVVLRPCPARLHYIEGSFCCFVHQESVQATLPVLLVHVRRLTDVQIINPLTYQHDEQMMEFLIPLSKWISTLLGIKAVMHIYDSMTGFIMSSMEKNSREKAKIHIMLLFFYLWHFTMLEFGACVSVMWRACE